MQHRCNRFSVNRLGTEFTRNHMKEEMRLCICAYKTVAVDSDELEAGVEGITGAPCDWGEGNRGVIRRKVAHSTPLFHLIYPITPMR